MKTVLIEGKRYSWREILRLRREQRKKAPQAQPPLFPLQEDARPQSQKTALGRWEEPTLFPLD